MIELCVIADDLTGAMDTGAQFAKRGVPTWVSLAGKAADPEIEPGVNVLVLDTESRHVDAGEAARRVLKAAGTARAAGAIRFYKKIDSTLRGNIGAELEALLRGVGRTVLFLIPAFPKCGRYTVGGTQYVEGRPVHETRFGADPRNPLKSSHIPDRIGEQSGLPVHIVPIEPSEPLFPRIAGASGIIVFDCTGDRDLRGIGRALAAAGRLDVVAGSAGFAEQLPDLLEMGGEDVAIAPAVGPTLIVNGSANDVSFRQIACARTQGVAEIVVPPQVLFREAAIKGPEGDEIVRQTGGILHQAGSVILRTAADRTELEAYLSVGRNRCGKGAPHSVAAGNLGALVERILSGCRIGTVVVIGGDTLFGVVEGLGVSGIRLKGEFAPGVALGEIEFDGRDLSVVSKSGGFGDPDFILKILRWVN